MTLLPLAKRSQPKDRLQKASLPRENRSPVKVSHSQARNLENQVKASHNLGKVSQENPGKVNRANLNRVSQDRVSPGRASPARVSLRRPNWERASFRHLQKQRLK